VAAPGAMNQQLRTGIAVIAVALGSWIVYETIHAGSDIPQPSSQVLTRLNGGSAGGKRIDGRSWSLDYTTATLSADGQNAEIEEVRDGLILRNGKPYARMKADHISANVTSNSFTTRGPVEVTELGGHHRRITTTDAVYAGDKQLLTLDHRAVIREGTLTVTVDRATMNFVTGETKLGRIEGVM
jgi:hypothetical protein